MKNTRPAAGVEVRRFAEARDAQFESVRTSAEASFKRNFDADSLLANPVLYLRSLFAAAGVSVVRKKAAGARTVGRGHAEKLGQVGSRGPEVQ